MKQGHVISQPQGCTNFADTEEPPQNSTRHQAWHEAKFHIVDPQILATTVQTLVAMATTRTHHLYIPVFIVYFS